MTLPTWPLTLGYPNLQNLNKSLEKKLNLTNMLGGKSHVLVQTCLPPLTPD